MVRFPHGKAVVAPLVFALLTAPMSPALAQSWTHLTAANFPQKVHSFVSAVPCQMIVADQAPPAGRLCFITNNSAAEGSAPRFMRG